MDRSFYIVTPARGRQPSNCIGTVLGRCSALHIAVAACDDFGGGSVARDALVIVESSLTLGEGEQISQSGVTRIFESDGTRF